MPSGSNIEFRLSLVAKLPLAVGWRIACWDKVEIERVPMKNSDMTNDLTTFVRQVEHWEREIALNSFHLEEWPVPARIRTCSSPVLCAVVGAMGACCPVPFYDSHN